MLPLNYLGVVERFFEDQAGGANRIAWELARFYRAQGHRVALLCGSVEGNPPAGSSIQQGIELVRFRHPQLPAYHPLRWRAQQKAAADSYRRHLSTERWDVVHTHNVAPGLGVLSALGASSAFRVATVHSPLVLEQKLNWVGNGWGDRLKRAFGFGILRRSEAKLLRAVDRVQVLSDYSERSLLEIHGEWLATRIVRLPWWMEAASRSLPTTHDAMAPFRFLCVRRLVPRTGVDLLLHAVAPLMRVARPWRLTVVGTGPEESSLRALSDSLGLADRVEFAGRVSEAQLQQQYAGADLFVLPTRDLECFGLIVLESYAHGLPVAGSSQGAIPELIKPLFPQGLVPVSDVPALTALLTRVLDGSLPLPAAEWIQTEATARWGRARIGQDYLALIQREQRVGATPDSGGER